ncbi:MAG: ferrochelatase [Propionibacteriaceae bacterium]|jgi:ferrochelatase|nr:ferrochelatase [Propionibacteriaceae bacterium]
MATGILLGALGTPTAPTAAAVAPFLSEFLSDARVIDYPRWFWLPLLNRVIIPRRAPVSAGKYASVWRDPPGAGSQMGSPLAHYTELQRQGVAARLGDGFTVETAVRYGEPNIPSTIARMLADGCERILVVPMHAQYSFTTVASVLDMLSDPPQQARKADDRHQPFRAGVRTIRSFEADAGYIEAAARRIEGFWAEHGRPDFAAGEKLLLSFHGIPKSYDKRGDPYQGQCRTTAKLLRERLGLGEDEALLTFQSKFGPAKWLTPATIDTVAKLGQQGVTRLDVFCPGFLADCLETCEEINLLNREAFEAAHGHQAGHHFHHIPCLNDDEFWLDALTSIIKNHLAQWTAK